MNNVIEARYTNAEQDTIQVLHTVDGQVIEEYIQVGSPAHTELVECGWDHEKIVDVTAEYKKQQLKYLHDLMRSVHKEEYEASIKENEEKLERKLKEANRRFQKEYEAIQHIYGLSLMDIMFKHNEDKEVLFKMKIDILEKDEVRNQPKEFKTRIRRAKKVSELASIVAEVL